MTMKEVERVTEFQNSVDNFSDLTEKDLALAGWSGDIQVNSQ